MTPENRIRQQLRFLYGNREDFIWPDLEKLLENFRSRNPHLIEGEFRLDEKDVILITYGDQFQEDNRNPLQCLSEFLNFHLRDCLNSVHILPFYPYSSDDGFSVINYRQVNPDFGTWDDINQLADNFHLMFDAVINHISIQSDWFNAFQRGEEPYKDYFIKMDPSIDLSSVFRPRALPLLTPVETKSGREYVWTTFSADQIDLNYANPELLLEIIDLILFYIERGARFIRLDAVGYIWKQVGTSSLNLPQAHSFVKLLKVILDTVAPCVGLITETNVPHEENIKYFGDPLGEIPTSEKPLQGDEAQLVYQFSLAPLVLHSFLSGDATVLSKWASTLSVPYKTSSFFNFIASHDGIGVMPAKGLLSEDEIEVIIDRTISHGGQVSYKKNADGIKSVYELNITLYDALNNPAEPNLEFDVKRFLGSQAIMLSLVGVPGIYIHSLFGSRNCLSCAEKTGRARSINREKFNLTVLKEKLADSRNHQSKVFAGYKQLLKIRRDNLAFHPFGSQRILEINQHVFSILRSDLENSEDIICLTNVSPEKQKLQLDLSIFNSSQFERVNDLISSRSFVAKTHALDITIDGYQTLWLKCE
jgi:glycosidase